MSNGKIIMAGYNNFSDYMAVCILPDGTLDKTFGDSGNGVYVRSQDEQVSCSAISDDKFLYIAGTTDGHILLAKIHLEPTVTGIENVEKIKNNYVHPVPTKGDFTFNSLENSNVDVYNSMGIKVASFAVTKGENNISLSLEPGWYVLRGDLGSHKIIIE